MVVFNRIIIQAISFSVRNTRTAPKHPNIEHKADFVSKNNFLPIPSQASINYKTLSGACCIQNCPTLPHRMAPRKKHLRQKYTSTTVSLVIYVLFKKGSQLVVLYLAKLVQVRQTQPNVYSVSTQ